MNERAEKMETDMEVMEDAPTVQGPISEPMNTDAMDRVIESAEKLDRYHAAMQKMRSLVVKNSYPGDWVSHSRKSDPVHLRKANITGAGAERIACFLGFQERNWKESGKIWSEDRKHYSYRFEADFSLGGRVVHAYGEASTQNKFYSFANGEWKPIEDVREDYIRKAAMRECRKEGIRAWLGLRAVPLTILQKEGMDLNVVNFVNFEGAEGAMNQEDKKKDGPPRKPGTISEAQRKRLFAIAKTAGWEVEQLKEFLKDQYQIEHTTDIPWKRYEEICRAIESGGSNVGE